MRRLLSLVIMVACAGCAEIVTHKADLAGAPDGVRVYPPRVLLFVDAKAAKSKIVYVPDFAKAYDVKPRTIFAKQDFEIDLADGGMVSRVKSNSDTAGFLTFLFGLAQTAAKAAGLPVSAEGIEGTFGLQSGVYELGQDGSVRRISP